MSPPAVHHEIVTFVRELRDAGLRIGVDQTECFATALGLVDLLSRRDLYLAARATLVFRREDMAVFDEVFDRFWSAGSSKGPQKTPQAPRHDPSEFVRTALASFMAQRARPGDPEREVPEAHKAASGLELLQRRDFGEVTDDERDEIVRVMRRMRFDPALRRTRRKVPSRRGDTPDMRRALRSYARYGAVLWVPRRERKWKRRPLVVLADISGSMERYSRLVLQFLHGLTQNMRHTETFVFGTRLTRITADLKLRDVETALDRATTAIVDFGGGTRIGDCLAAFRREYASRVLRRGAVVLVVSDGWDTGDPEALGREVAEIRARCHRLVWLNPLLGRANYQATVRGMAAALEHVDDFLPVHDLQSLEQLASHLASLPARRGNQRPASRGGFRETQG